MIKPILDKMDKKTHDIRFKVSKEEYDKIKKKCDQSGLTISAFMRYLALKSTIKVTIE